MSAASPQIISRAEAKALGLKHYYTGKPCGRGHLDYRSTTGNCLTCSREAARNAYQANPTKFASYKRNRYKEHRETVLANNARWVAKDRERNLKRHRDYHASNRERYREVAAAHYQSNKAQYIARARERENHLKVCVLGDARKINEFYNMCPEGHHVDHIVPLKHELVCGLHCLANLQYLPAAENLSKGNSFEPFTIWFDTEQRIAA